jgi:hypothetical protein
MIVQAIEICARTCPLFRLAAGLKKSKQTPFSSVVGRGGATAMTMLPRSVTPSLSGTVTSTGENPDKVNLIEAMELTLSSCNKCVGASEPQQHSSSVR